MNEHPTHLAHLGVKERSDTERWVAWSLIFGSYGSFALLVLAGVVSVAGAAEWALRLSTAGVVLMLATPALRLVATLLHFAAQKQWKLALVCVVLLAIITLATFTGMHLH